MLEPYDAKVSRTVLRRGGRGDSSPLFGEPKISYEKVDSELQWLERAGLKNCEIRLTFKTDPSDRNNWREQHIWFKETLEKFYVFFQEKIKTVTADKSN